MVRNKDFIKNNKQDLIFQICDWKSYDVYVHNEENEDEENDENNDNTYKKKVKRLVIQGYGITNNGNSISIRVNHFQPHFYIKIPETWDDRKLKSLKNEIMKEIPEYAQEGLGVFKVVEKKEFYGFTNNKLFKYGYFNFKNQSCYYSFLRVLKEKKIYIKRLQEEFDFSKKIYETKVNPLLRFYHTQNIEPAGWCMIPAKQYNFMNHEKETRCQIEIQCSYDKVQRSDIKDIAKYLIASFDIECTSSDGSFPKATRKEDEMIQIGTTVYEYGTNKCVYQYICTLKDCDPIEGVDVESYDNERDLIIGWAKFIEKIDPDIMTGYNIWGFDWEYIYERAKLCNCLHILFRKLNRIKISEKHKNELTVQDLSSSALGQNILKFIDIEGIVQIDLLKVVQRDHKLDSYKLDNVAKTFMKQQKVDLSPKELFKNYREGSSDKIKEIAVYCVKDCSLVNELMNKLQIVTNNLGMANVCIVPFSYLFTRGQGIKIFSLVVKFCNDENFIIKDMSPDDIDKGSYEGAIVFVPNPGVYFEPVVVMDYNSLYPSSMIAENISHDSILGFKEYVLKTKKSKNESDNYELVKDTIDYQYQDLEGYHYIDIEYDTFEGVGDDKQKVGYKMCRFAELDNGEKSVLPRILRKLLKARKDTRKIMKYTTVYFEDGSNYQGLYEEKEDGIIEINNLELGVKEVHKESIVKTEITNNEFQISVLDGLQLAYKVTCNSLYGQVGATTSPICYKELAASTTATGRRMVITARDLTLEKFECSKLTYGDSVSGDTPLMLMKNGYICFSTIQDLNNEWVQYQEFKPFDSNRYEKQQTYADYLIWTSNGWSKINRVIRHKTYKKMYRVFTPLGIVDVTEDHSLLDKDKNIIKPEKCSSNTELLYGFPISFPTTSKYQQMSKVNMQLYIEDIYLGMIDIIPYEILNNIYSQRLQFVQLFLEKNEHLTQKSKLFYQTLYYLLKSVEKDININEVMNKYFNYNDKFHLELASSANYVQEIEYIGTSNLQQFVYDIETETGNFQAGIGQLIVKNTDSIFVNFSDTIRKRFPDKKLDEKDLLEQSIIIGEEAAAHINSHMKAPQNIEYEKTFWPFCIFSKKRYFGNKYEFDLEKYKQTSMGIVLKRRDNAPIVKTIYGGVIDIILNKRDIEASKKFFKDSIKNLLEGNVDISQLVISKTVRTDYSNPTLIAHKVLADRMGERDPGNKPQSNDRIPYCFIDPCNLLCTICKVKIKPEKTKCVNCMNLFCPHHLSSHRSICYKICRFCRVRENEAKDNLEYCSTCLGYYCKKCHTKHNMRKDKYKVTHHDKCKKPLSTKLIQGDTIEHPQYITEQKLKIDYNYYLTNQIQKPVYQIFELVMNKPESIIEDIVRDRTNKKNGNSNIKQWFQALNKEKVSNEHEDKKHSLKKKVENIIDDDDINLLGDEFEEDIIDDPDATTLLD